MEDLFKAVLEFVVQFVVEATFHLLGAAVEYALHQCGPRLAVGIVLCILPLIGFAVVNVEISAGGISASNILIGSAVVALLSGPSAYCFLTRNVGHQRNAGSRRARSKKDEARRRISLRH